MNQLAGLTILVSFRHHFASRDKCNDLKMSRWMRNGELYAIAAEMWDQGCELWKLLQ